MKQINSISDLVDDILDTRSKSQNGRFKKLDDDVERVSDVVAGLMQRLSDHLSAYQFQYSKSKKQLHKTVNSFRCEITCQTDAENLSGVYVGVAFLVSIRNNKYKHWHENIFSDGKKGYLLVCDVATLVNGGQILKWNLVDPGSRQAEIEQIILLLEEHVLPFFNIFVGNNAYAEYLKNKNFKVVSKHQAILHAVWLGETLFARQLINEILESKRVGLKEFEERQVSYLEHGYPDVVDWGDHVGEWVKKTIQLGLSN